MYCLAQGWWALHKFYSRSSGLSRYLPPTAVLSRKTLSAFLRRYSSVYIKPDAEHTGTGNIRAWKKNGRYSFVKVKGKKRESSSVEGLYYPKRRQQRSNEGSCI
ncbi:YheC/YheD family protein [Brevibacillus centrosporus]|uniref:YheC/YheD family protein n=1 Tax=Brevibacillus centrosporus TaxID=54910 RepID=UPI002E1EF562